MSGEREEQLILRFSDKDLATRIKGILAEDPILGSTSRIELRFDGETFAFSSYIWWSGSAGKLLQLST